MELETEMISRKINGVLKLPIYKTILEFLKKMITSDY